VEETGRHDDKTIRRFILDLDAGLAAGSRSIALGRANIPS
jgi:hypothetical protein